VLASEQLIRLLFHHRMVDSSGVLGSEAFPTEELIEKNGKSVSVDRLSMINRLDLIYHKLLTYENPTKGRAKWGHAVASRAQIEAITSQCGKQVFSCCSDPVVGNFPPNPWDAAHAKVTRARAEYSRGFVRGYKDKLCLEFQKSVFPIA